MAGKSMRIHGNREMLGDEPSFTDFELEILPGDTSRKTRGRMWLAPYAGDKVALCPKVNELDYLVRESHLPALVVTHSPVGQLIVKDILPVAGTSILTDAQDNLVPATGTMLWTENITTVATNTAIEISNRILMTSSRNNITLTAALYKNGTLLATTTALNVSDFIDMDFFYVDDNVSPGIDTYTCYVGFNDADRGSWYVNQTVNGGAIYGTNKTQYSIKEIFK